MNANWLNDLGDRNPQLLRELRGRFQPRSVLATIGIVVVLQVLLLLFFTAQLPAEDKGYSSYCLGAIRAGCPIDWPDWWGDLFKTLTYIIPYALYIPGAFALVNDISQETQKGTLNFLRLSARSSQNILLGKLLGVPILGYFSLLLLLPLHFFAGFMGGIPLGFFVSFYLALFAWAGVLFTSSMFVGFSGAAQSRVIGIGGASGLAIVVLIAIAWIPSINYFNSITIWQKFGISGFSLPIAPIHWFGWPINQDWLLAHLFLCVNLALVSYWLWRVLQRTFRKPTATALSKRQGYLIVTYALVLTLGLVWKVVDRQTSLTPISGVASMTIGGMIPLIFTLSTPRQMLLDWLQGRREVAIAQRAANLSPGKRRSEQIRDCLFGDKSPGLTAIAICGLIAYLLISLLLPSTGKHFGKAVLGLALSFTLVANYAVLVQLMLLLETAKRYVWALGSVIFAIVVPGFCSVIPGLNLIAGYFTPGLWFLLNNLSTYSDDVGVFMAFAAWGFMLILLVGQSLILRDRLRRLGRSAQPDRP
jgi:hypothetical protein